MTFIATADDLFDGKVDDAQFKWTSDRDGALGNGASSTSRRWRPARTSISATVTELAGRHAHRRPVTITSWSSRRR